ncbi:hypothetical protein AgCh_000637 [Apium graveolens]
MLVLLWMVFKRLSMILLSEIDLKGGKFTWEKSRGTADWVKERLDRSFSMREWLHMFPLCKLSVIHVPASDHDPFLLDLISVAFSRKQFHFHFENTWLQEPNFHKEITYFWLALPLPHILPKLISVSNFKARWGRNFFHKFRDKVKKQKELLSSLVNRVDSDRVKLYFEDKDRVNELLLHEELVKNCFVDIFRGDQVSSVERNGDLNPVVTEAHNQLLVADLFFADFTITFKEMHPDKASGPDGLNPAFFSEFMADPRKRSFICCRYWLHDNSFPANLNDTNVMLIPKKENACCMKGHRPIALCNVL